MLCGFIVVEEMEMPAKSSIAIWVIGLLRKKNSIVAFDSQEIQSLSEKSCPSNGEFFALKEKLFNKNED